ncbi:alanine racemase [Agilicoccus flavus]|uniref:alanine racemase n=1 Tax=Agilicoccus flavus TaxID=2775968 RepID=UPI001CF61891|nr:alanine racemase [Agilicoccus flavus]
MTDRGTPRAGAPDSRLFVRHDVLHDNLRAIRSRVGPDVAILLPVKADAYGHGAVEVAARAEAAGVVDRFGVATVAEGVALRRAGIRLPILKLSPAPARDVPDALRHDVTLTVASRADVAAVAEALEQAGGPGRRDPIPVHLKVDTGMGRIGVPVADARDESGLADVARVAAAVAAVPGLLLDGVFTHLAASDTPGQDAFTAGQLATFAAAVAAVEAVLDRRPAWIHAANSGGVLAHPDSWLTLVRPGIMSYGYYPDAATPRTVDVRPALEWRARVSFVKEVPATRTVGYGRTWAPERDTLVATLPVGYADGFDRHLSNRGRAEVAGRARPVVGRVCMDQLMLDLGPEGGAAVGDEAVLLGETYTAADMAADLGTIPYEIVCAIGARVARVHLDGPLERDDPREQAG